VTSRLTYPETRAALAAAHRSKRIDRRALRRCVAELDGAWAALSIIDIDAALAKQAGELSEQYALRGYDGVQLACALAVEDPFLVMATWDRELARAALKTGRAVAPRR
jgi:predicted nucleic acid-binding protein